MGAALTADKTWPDPAEFDDDQERDGDPARVMDGEDPSATGGSGEQRERAGHEQRRDQRRETPVGAAGGHSVSLGAQAGRVDRPRAQRSASWERQRQQRQQCRRPEIAASGTGGTYGRRVPFSAWLSGSSAVADMASPSPRPIVTISPASQRDIART